jgi:hypothetical protein
MKYHKLFADYLTSSAKYFVNTQILLLVNNKNVQM